MEKIPNRTKHHTYPEVVTGAILKKCLMENFAKLSWKQLCCYIFLIKLQAFLINFIDKDTPTQMFSCEIYSDHIFFGSPRMLPKCSNNIHFYVHLFEYDSAAMCITLYDKKRRLQSRLKVAEMKSKSF